MNATMVDRKRFRLAAVLATTLALLPGQAADAQDSSTAPTGAPPIPVTMTLQDFIDAAVKNGDELRIVEGNLAAARAQYRLAASKDALSLSAAGSYGLTDGIGSELSFSSVRSLLGGAYQGIAQSIQGSLSLVQGTQSASNPNTKIGLTLTQNFPASSSSLANTVIGISASQSIWDGYPGGQTRAAVEKSIIALRSKEISTAQSRSLIVLNVKKAYITMLSAQRTLTTRLGILDKQNALQKQVAAIFDLRQASSVDLQNAIINAKTASLDVETAKHDLSLARQRLANLAGMDSASDFSVAETSVPGLPATTLEEAIAVGLDKRPELGLAELNKKSTAIDLDLAKGQANANVSVTGGLNLAVIWSQPATNAGSANLGLKVGLPFFDAGATNALVDSNLALMGVYDTQKRQLAKSIAADIRDAFWMASIQSEKVDLARQSADLYSTKLAIVKAQNSFGTASLQDLLSTSVDAANAEASFATAKSSYLLAVLALEASMGL